LIKGCAKNTLRGIEKEKGGLYHFFKVSVARLNGKMFNIGSKLIDSAMSMYVDMLKKILIGSGLHKKNSWHIWHQRLGHAVRQN